MGSDSHRLMGGTARREQLAALLRAANGEPVAGAELANRLGVSRQVIVQDIALLRANGRRFIGTPGGYLLLGETAPTTLIAVLPCRHGIEQVEQELNIMVDCGLRVLDVVVEHPLYGELRGNLMISERADVQRFLVGLRNGEYSMLSALTGGVHLHTVEAPAQTNLAQARQQLGEAGILLEEQ
jgi:transcriptional regulator of NAD metabolism